MQMPPTVVYPPASPPRRTTPPTSPTAPSTTTSPRHTSTPAPPGRCRAAPGSEPQPGVGLYRPRGPLEPLRSRDPAGVDRGLQGLVVALVQVGVGVGEVADGAVEGV